IETLGMLASQAWRCYQAVRHTFDRGKMLLEREMSCSFDNGVKLSGHPDLVSIDASTAHVLDWKTGWIEPRAKHQLMAYGAIIAANYPKVDTVVGCVALLRQGVIDWGEPPYLWSRGELLDWAQTVPQTFGLEVYAPSLHTCRFCPRRYECPARTRLLRSAMDV